MRWHFERRQACWCGSYQKVSAADALANKDYDLVLGTLSGVQDDVFRDFEWSRPLAAASMEVLRKTGLTAADLRKAAYPDVLVAQS